MAIQGKPWQDVGERFDTLGTHLRTHFDEVSADAAAERAEFEKALRAVLAGLQEGLGTAGKAVRDPALRRDLNDLAVAVREALLATFESAGEQVRERISRPIRKARGTSAVKHAPARKPVARTASRRTVAHK